MARRAYRLLTLCWQSRDAAVRHVGVVAFAEGLGDSEALQAVAADEVEPVVSE